MNNVQRTKNRLLLVPALLIGVGLFVASCGSTESAEVTASETVIEENENSADEIADGQAEVDAEDPASDAEPSEPDDPSEAATIEQLSLPTRDVPTQLVNSSAMGGISFEAPDDYELLITGDSIGLAKDLESGERNVAVGLISQTINGDPVATVEDYLTAFERFAIPVEPTGRTIEVLSFELAEYQPAFVSPEPILMFATGRRGLDPNFGFGPSDDRPFFAGATPSGVLVASWGGVDASQADLDEHQAALGSLVNSLTITGPGLDPSLPDAESFVVGEPSDPALPAERAEGDDATPSLGEPFRALDPGTYEVLNFGVPVSVDVPEGWWVQPNFPSFVVLAAPMNPGPGQRDILWLNDITGFAVSNGGPRAIGDPLAPDIEAFLAAPPQGVEVSDINRETLTGTDGATLEVVSFAIETGVGANCSESEPCDVLVSTSYGATTTLWASHSNRVWWFPDHPAGPSMAIAGDLEGGVWLDEASSLMDTLALR